MPEVKNRMDNPAPEVAYQEIQLPDDKDFGTGTMRFKTKKNTLTPPVGIGPKTIAAMLINPPRFQMTATINTGEKVVAVRLGRADGTLLSRMLFALPADLDTGQSHEFEIPFAKWKLSEMSMDGSKLQEKTM